MVDIHLVIPARVLWVLTPAMISNAGATLPGGWGPPMDFGRLWPGDGKRIFGPSKTWSGFLFGIVFGLPFGLLEAWLILLAPPNLAIVPQYGPTVLASVPVVFLICAGAMVGDAFGSFVKRRLGRPSGSRSPLLDPLPFVVLPIGLGLAFYPLIFFVTFFSLEALLWVLVFTIGLHILFNWVGYRLGTKTVPW